MRSSITSRNSPPGSASAPSADIRSVPRHSSSSASASSHARRRHSNACHRAQNIFRKTSAPVAPSSHPDAVDAPVHNLWTIATSRRRPSTAATAPQCTSRDRPACHPQLTHEQPPHPDLQRRRVHPQLPQALLLLLIYLPRFLLRRRRLGNMRTDRSRTASAASLSPRSISFQDARRTLYGGSSTAGTVVASQRDRRSR